MPLLHSCNHYYVCGGIRIKPELFALLRKKSVLTVNIIYMDASQIELFRCSIMFVYKCHKKI